MSLTLRGILVPTITPFHADGSIDEASYRSLCRHLLKAGVHGLVVNGTTGESPTVSFDEVERLLEWTKEEAAGSVPVIVGTGTNDTATTLEQTRRARDLGADAALVVVPYYSRPSQDGILEHFGLASEQGLPIVGYNIPYRTAVALELSTLRQIMELPGVVALKESTGGLANTMDLVTWCKKSILCGEDLLVFVSLCLGASGGILAAAGVRTEEYVRLFEELEAGALRAARERFLRLSPLISMLFEESNPAPLKFALMQQGIIAGDHLRRPLKPISARLRERLASQLK